MHSKDQAGATAVEYGLMVALVAAVMIAAVAALGGDVLGLYGFVCGGASPFTC